MTIYLSHVHVLFIVTLLDDDDDDEDEALFIDHMPLMPGMPNDAYHNSRHVIK